MDVIQGSNHLERMLMNRLTERYCCAFLHERIELESILIVILKHSWEGNHYTFSVEEIEPNYFVVGNNNKNGIIDLSGKALVDLKYNSIFHIDGTDLLQANISDKNTISLIDKKTMKILATMDNAKVEIDDNYIRLYSDKESKYFSDTGKELITRDAFPNNKLYAKKVDGKWGEKEIPLQPTLLVKATSLKKIDGVAKEIQNLDPDKTTIKLVKYGEDMVKQLISLFDIVRKISVGVVVALIVVTAFLISNTIKITIFSRKKEIEIMRLVGASNINIKIPFIFEGLFLGVLGSIIPIIATTYGYVAIFKNFNGQLFSPFIRLITPEPFIYLVSGILLLIGMLVGMFGSYLAVRKHLKI